MPPRSLRFVFPLLALLALLASACEGDDDHDDADAGADGGGDGDADADADGDADADADADADGGARRVVVGETNGALVLPFTLDATGMGAGAIGEIAIAGGSGIVEVEGVPLEAVAYEHQAWPEIGLDLFQTLIVAPDRWIVMWLYCEGSNLVNTYWEATDGSRLVFEAAAGTCAFSDDLSVAAVTFPAVDMRVGWLVDGFRVAGPQIAIDGAAPGVVRLGVFEMTVLAFEWVNCWTECGLDPGWHELHAILVDRAGRRACFGIFYLFPDERPVLLTYSLTLPDLTDPAGETELAATWEQR